jgi:hypothetical protein
MVNCLVNLEEPDLRSVVLRRGRLYSSNSPTATMPLNP